ncbi:MAG: FKBP-type peptidyl-prolyl cis-trans isomerase [Tannerella sp.]|jgi:peptidylprolyl isomerase/FKBP-type peptidyl-prolyl cis-trans isomerase FklB|nr:FKBP-type peptidyl-prolyl cis-trans isomerase [Tannerella sp.]
MKKNILYILTLLLLAACSKDDDSAVEEWQLQNEQAFNAIAKNPEYTEIKSPGNNGSIYYKVLQKGTGTKPIYYTSTVGAYYKGWFVAAYADKGITAGTVFDQKLFDDGTPLQTVVGTGVIGGWTVALQHMVEGDKWEIWIPYQLGYGVSGSEAIPGYSTLAFEIEVVKVYGVEEL